MEGPDCAAIVAQALQERILPWLDFWTELSKREFGTVKAAERSIPAPGRLKRFAARVWEWYD